jgi:peroxiredoxin
LSPSQREVTEVLAVAIDEREQQAQTIDRVAETDGRVLDFPLLSDPDHAVIARYGLLNQFDPEARPIPHPTTFVIDRSGVVRWKFIEINYRIRPTNEDILAALADVQGGAEPSAPPR